MIVYREQRSAIPTRASLQRIASAQGMERWMELGELEAGVADALCPDCDRDLEVLRDLRKLYRNFDPAAAARLPLPNTVEVSVPEGFAYYALDPELYRIAARRFAAEVRPRRVAVIGIRSIGTTLSAVVEDELGRLGCETAAWTVRPRGHPWSRTLRVAPCLEKQWRAWEGDFAVVDEGPGLSGSSFSAVAKRLSDLGVPEERVALFPSWLPDPEGFISEDARYRWARHRKYSASFEDLCLFPSALDLSAGKWRSLCGQWPAVHPQHERRKYLVGNRLYKFAGYGRYGREKLERAGVLSDFIPPVSGLERGFLATVWTPARPARLSAALIDWAARYVASVGRQFPTGGAADFDLLAGMIEANVPAASGLQQWRGAVMDGCALKLDARMLPHEWLESADGFLKADALEHHDDHFFPGPQDAAWDLAGFSVEHELDAGGEARLVETYRRESGDRGINSRLGFYRLAYLAFRFGYADMAIEALRDSPEAAGFRALRERYSSMIERETAHG